MIRIFTIRDLLTTENRKRVFPLLFDLYYVIDNKATEKFSLVENIGNATVAIFPVDVIYILNSRRGVLLREFIAAAQIAGIPICIYAGGDFGRTFDENCHVFRLSGFRTKLSKFNYILPSFVSDPYVKILNGSWRAISKAQFPSVGFVGQANGSKIKFLKEFIIYARRCYYRTIKKDFSDSQNFYPASFLRFKTLKNLEQNSIINSDFIYRSNYRAGAKTVMEIEATTDEFYKNIERNLYTLCIRGAGNFSVRFYETLMMGRIPILVDTDVQLPLMDSIEWENHIIFATIDTVAQHLIDFHASKSCAELIDIQISNRKLMIEKLNRVDYFVEVFKNDIK